MILKIIKGTVRDLPLAVNLACLLWSGHTEEELLTEYNVILNDQNAAVFLAYAEDKPIGFAQCGLRRDYVEGTETTPVGYLEGIYVKEQYRREGIAEQLLQVCESWSKEKGCREFASDCEIDNNASLNFHLHTGFQETNRIICFTKKL